MTKKKSEWENMEYSYQDLGNNQEKEEAARDLIIICQTSPEEFWCNFRRKRLTASAYFLLCQKITKYSKKNYPAPYLGGGIDFYRLFFLIAPGVFIPQKDTEILVEKLLELTSKKNYLPSSLRVLDIGTGCGNIAISLAKIKPEWQVVATDINDKALRLAQKNSSLHQVKNVNFCRSDLFSNLDPHQKFDIIVSNPPYVSSAEYQQLSGRTKKQPREALLAPEDGYFFYRKICQQAARFLAPQFLLIMEIGSQQQDRILALAKNYFPAAQVEVFPDYADQPRSEAGRTMTEKERAEFARKFCLDEKNKITNFRQLLDRIIAKKMHFTNMGVVAERAAQLPQKTPEELEKEWLEKNRRQGP
ncbi:6532_t:CDS:2 [Gigaspora margarita]|uniref:peptide chain release factor N(5)-glutamine methyltransferase n=1 Tax=Gigaspora margarita TaxID=4874 RepID=A0ABM8W6B6_GIGMA|nr:6532_t:CDS:2 [Gigaspora margarita]